MKYKLTLCKNQLVVLGKSQADVARDAGTSRSVVSKFFNGHPIRNSTAKAIIERGLGLQMNDVVAKNLQTQSAIRRRQSV